MNKLINPELSDRILNFLLEKIKLGDYEEFKSHDFPESDFVSVDAIDVMLDDLKEKGLVEILTRGHSGYDYTYEIAINKKAIDFQRLGGFGGLEKLLKQNLETLVETLGTLPDLPEEKAKTIRNAIDGLKQYLANYGT